jgi:hypothetical protein
MPISLLDLLPHDNIHVRKVAATHGGEYQGPCPVCGGKDRFHVWPEEGEGGKWWCRGCERGGDIIQYLRDIRKLSYLEACLEAGREPVLMKRSFDWKNPEADQGQGRKWEPREIIQPPAEWGKKCAAFVDWAHEQLLETPQVLSYMTCGRGITLEAIKTTHLGYNLCNLTRERGFWGLPEKFKDDGTPQTIWLPQGVVIPYFADGILQRARIRRINLEGRTPVNGPPYCIVSGSTSAAMVLGSCSQVAVVVESELDAILLHQELYNLAGVVAVGSAQARPDSHAAGILRASDLILVALDNDDQRPDGQNPGAKEAQWWLAHFPQARRLPPVDGKDPGEMRRNGVDLQRWVAIGINKYFPQVHSQGQSRPQPVQEPVGQPSDSPPNQPLDFETLSAIATPRYEKVAGMYPDGCNEWLIQARPDLVLSERADEDWINEVWKLCMFGKSTFQDFEAALDIWVEGWAEIIKLYKERKV